jgi:hypothetical protein
MRKFIVIIMLFTLLPISNVYASRKEQTPWWTLKRHWDNSVTKDDKLCLEYMSRVGEYEYTVPQKPPIRKVAVLPPLHTNRFAIKSLGYFEKDVLFNMDEMENEFLMEPKKWTVTKNHSQTYETIIQSGIYDAYSAWIESFIAYRRIDMNLFSEMKRVLDVDTFLLLLIGKDVPGATTELIDSQAWTEDRFGFLNIYLLNADNGKIRWEYGKPLKLEGHYIRTRWRGDYRTIFKTMPIE